MRELYDTIACHLQYALLLCCYSSSSLGQFILFLLDGDVAGDGPFLESDTMITVAIGMFFKILLMCRMSRCKLGQWRNVRGDGLVLVGSSNWFGSSSQVLLQFVANRFAYFCLCLIVAKDPTGVLKTVVVALSILGGGVVKLKKEANEFLKMSFWIVQFYKDNFNVTRLARTNLLVGWIGNGRLIVVRTHEAYGCLLDAVGKLFAKVLGYILFGSPITTSTQGDST